MAERRRLEHEILEIADNERRRIGLDLHDDLGQKLTGVALMSKGLQTRLTKNGSEASQEAARIHTLIQEAMNQARELSHEMVTLDLQTKDLVSAMEGIASNTQRTFNISCRFQCDGEAPELEPNVVNQLHKIAQEAITNAVKHAKAKKIDIRLSTGAERLTMSICNDGATFPSVLNKKAGLGLRIMSYRAHLIGATNEAGPGKAGGGMVTCSLPLLVS
jgi:signal transduction histidine kinase